MNTKADDIETALLLTAERYPDYPVTEIISVVTTIGYLRPTVRRVKSELLHKLNSIDGVNLPEDSINRRPSINFSLLDTGDKLREFFDAYEWFLEEIKES